MILYMTGFPLNERRSPPLFRILKMIWVFSDFAVQIIECCMIGNDLSHIFCTLSRDINKI